MTSVKNTSNLLETIQDQELPVQEWAETEEVTFDWKIPMGPQILGMHREQIESPVFVSRQGEHGQYQSHNQISWKLRCDFQPVGLGDNDILTEDVQVELLCVSMDERSETDLQYVKEKNEIEAFAFVYVVEEDLGMGGEHYLQLNEELELEAEGQAKAPAFKSLKAGDVLESKSFSIKQTKVEHGSKNNGSNTTDDGKCIRINCKIIVKNEKIKSPKSSELNINQEMSKLKILENDIDHSLNYDVDIITRTKTLPGSKVFLAAQSPVFAAIFQEASSVEINDFSSDVVEAMLEFLNKGESSMLQEYSSDLLELAERFKLAELKAECEHYIASHLMIWNAADVLHLAVLNKALTLKAAAVRYIKRNKKRVSVTESYKNLAKFHPTVLLELYLSPYI